MGPTRLTQVELFPSKLPSSLLLRAQGTVAFMHQDDMQGTCVDVGERNPLTILIEKHFHVKVDSFTGDLDRDVTPHCHTMLCYEVLEHLYNPLFFLENVHADVLYLSTPYQIPQVLKAKHHYHEIPNDRLSWLFTEAGWEIKRQATVTIAGHWYEHLRGIRPFLRYFQKTRIFKLCKQ